MEPAVILTEMNKKDEWIDLKYQKIKDKKTCGQARKWHETRWHDLQMQSNLKDKLNLWKLGDSKHWDIKILRSITKVYLSKQSGTTPIHANRT